MRAAVRSLCGGDGAAAFQSTFRLLNVSRRAGSNVVFSVFREDQESVLNILLKCDTKVTRQLKFGQHSFLSFKEKRPSKLNFTCCTRCFQSYIQPVYSLYTAWILVSGEWYVYMYIFAVLAWQLYRFKY